MYFLYSILLGIGVVALLPRFLLDAARHGKYAAGLGERAGSLPRFDAGGRPVVWLHCVSVGEAQAARPLARALLEEYPGHALVVSTEPTLKGATVSNVNKPAKLENGVTISVPPFINEGDRIRVDPVEGRYMERAK